MKKRIYSLFSVIFTLVLSIVFSPASHAMTGQYGGWSVDDYAGTNKSPLITGVVMSSCNSGLTLTLAKDQMDIMVNSNVYKFNSANSDFYYSTWNGVWQLDLPSKHFVLENGYYTIKVQCNDGHPNGFGGTYYLSQTFPDVLYVYPQSCDDTDTECIPIYRFYNYIEGSHFYTAVNNEKHTLMSMPYKYHYEGISGFASAGPYDSGMAVHRFYNKTTGTHFYTANQAEASHVNDTMGSTYRYEGVAFYADSSQQYDSSPMHRFYKFKQGVHFYTAVQSEATTVNNTMYSTYRYEGVPFYIINNV